MIIDNSLQWFLDRIGKTIHHRRTGYIGTKFPEQVINRERAIELYELGGVYYDTAEESDAASYCSCNRLLDSKNKCWFCDK